MTPRLGVPNTTPQAAGNTAAASSSGAASDDNLGPWARFQAHLVGTAKGSFLFAQLILDLVEKGRVTIKSSSFQVLPQTLAQVFLLEFNLRFPTANSFAQVSDILAVCLASLQPLTLGQIFSAVSGLTLE